MKSVFSKLWNRSKQPRKQRKYRANAPVHIKRKFMSVNLSKELRKKHNIKSIIIRKGDKVKIMTGKNKGTVGKVEIVDIKNEKVSISGIEITKKEGSKRPVFIHPSNMMITELNLDDKLRIKKSDSKKKGEDKHDKKSSK